VKSREKVDSCLTDDVLLIYFLKVFGCKLIAALSSSKCDFFGILPVRKLWLLCFAGFLRPSWL
jgi:hypothetical protein